EKSGENLVAELRAMHANLPILIAAAELADEMRARFAGDRCAAIISKPYNAASCRAPSTRCAGTAAATPRLTPDSPLKALIDFPRPSQGEADRLASGRHRPAPIRST